MNLIDLSCRKCGGKLKEDGTGKFKCAFCGAVYYEENVRKEVQTLSSLLDNQKQEQLANLRRLLWNELKKEYTDSMEIVSLCKAIKKIYPDDFYANLYETLNGGNDREISDFIDKIDVKENYEDVPEVLNFMFKSLSSSHLLSVGNLIERAYGRNRGQYEKYMTEFEKEAEKVEGGLYDPSIPRDVFIMYSSKDIKKVKELAEYLEESGTTCFVAARNLQHGRGAVENYQRAIETAMDSCKVIVFVSSTNSRRTDCDAIRLEMPYIKKQDLSRAPTGYFNNYEKLPDKHKKPRVEYVIEGYTGRNAVESVTKEFFGTLQWAQSVEAVAERVAKILVAEPAIEEPINEKKVKYCLSCGRENDIGANFCVTCSGDKFVETYEEYEKEFNARVIRENQAKKKAELKEQKKAEREEKREQKRAARSANRTIRSHKIVTRSSSFEEDAVISTIVLDVFFAIMGIIYFIVLNITPVCCYTASSIWLVILTVIFGLASLFLFIGAIVFLTTDAPAGETNFTKTNIIHLVVYVLLTVVSIIAGCAASQTYTWSKIFCMIGLVVFILFGIWAIIFKRVPDIAFVAGLFIIGMISLGITNMSVNKADYLHENFLYLCKEETGVNARVLQYDEMRLILPNEVNSEAIITFKAPYEYFENDVLKYVDLPDMLQKIDDRAFSGCKGLIGVAIPEGVKFIGKDAFKNCSSLESIYIPASVTMIEEGAFAGCESLTIYCARESEPTDQFGLSQWGYNWNGGRTVVWEYVPE